MMRARRSWPCDFVTMHAMYTPRDALWRANELKVELWLERTQVNKFWGEVAPRLFPEWNGMEINGQCNGP